MDVVYLDFTEVFDTDHLGISRGGFITQPFSVRLGFKSDEMYHTGVLKLYFKVALETVNKYCSVHTISYFVFHFI